MTRTPRVLLTATLALATAGAVATVTTQALAAPPPTFNVRDFGARGNGTAVDSPAFDRAISAASPVGGIVVVPSGTYLSRTIHLKSNMTLRLDAGATIVAAGSGLDRPEPNPFSRFQDFGHSHFTNALLYGDRIDHLTITGSGTIDGVGLVTGDDPGAGVGDKTLSLTRCSNLVVRGVTFRRGGHFAAILNGCHDVLFDGVNVQTGNDRDGLNIINTWNVEVTNSTVVSSDDAVVFKSDFALGQTFPSTNIWVHDSRIGSMENNALQFGSETCGDFRDARFERVTVTGAGKAGLGIVSMDGATIENVSYRDITLTRTTIPVFLKIGSRGRCPGKPPAGHIRNIAFSNVTGTNLRTPRDVAGDDEYSSTLTGAPGGPRVENVTFTGVKLTVPGGHPASDANRNPPEKPTTFPPRDYGPRPAYGFWMRHVQGIRFVDCTVQFDRNDGRPAFLADDGAAVSLSGVTVERGSGSPYDVGFRRITGYAVTGGGTTGGAALRVRATASTPL